MKLIQFLSVMTLLVPPAVPAEPAVDAGAAALAIEDMAKTWPSRFDAAKARSALEAHRRSPDEKTAAQIRAALLENPLLKFEKLLLVNRGAKQLGLTQNWNSNSSLPKNGYDNDIAVLSPVSPSGTLRPLYKPADGGYAGDLDLDFDAQRLMFSSIGTNRRWQVFEMAADGSGVRELPLIPDGDIDNYGGCYLPDGAVIFSSSAPFTGVPCVQGSSHVSNFYRYDPGTGRIRRLTFEQDHDWCPTVLEDGRVLYLRWEYSDLPHFVSRILFTMNPDGTNQREFYGSNSYWPNSMFYARPIPGDPSKFVAVVSGHHDTTRMGELVLFDSARGRREAQGALQRIPGRGRKVEAVIRDGLVSASWPKFLHPWPLSANYFLVAAQPGPGSNWGLYLADVFDNLTLLKEVPGRALLEPVPLLARKRPPVLASGVKPESTNATVYIADLYAGSGLGGVPRGTVKRLRLLTYHFAYHGMGGQVNRVGLDGPWDVKRIIGTVPVEADGSAFFQVPANTPISIQPLDGEGRALQLMRSWMTAMPGERVSCIGCHESQNTVPPARTTYAMGKAPADIAPWHGPTRGFSFRREVQPVLDRHCVSCHAEKAKPDFRDGPDVHPKALASSYNNGTKFPPSYLALRSFVRTPTIESDMHLLMPAEYAANTTALVQMLKQGHYGVRLDPESWERLYTWIDLNTPAHGTWHEIVGEKLVDHQRDRRRELMCRYGGTTEDPESVGEPPPGPPAAAAETHNPGLNGQASGAPDRGLSPGDGNVTAAGGRAPGAPRWGFPPEEAVRRQRESGNFEQPFDLGQGSVLRVVRIPPGSFGMGDETEGGRPERIEKAFWIGKFEIRNDQFAVFDPDHDSRLETGDFLQFSEQERGYPVNQAAQPVCRVPWNRAVDFCRWLSAKTGRRFSLPTEAQWEWACRAGSPDALWFGGEDADFTPYENLADTALRSVDTFGWSLPSGAIPPWRPAADRFNDHFHVSAPVGSFKPNPWGLHDMHGNVAEWTLGENGAEKVTRGGSWYDRPRFARSAARLSYPPWQGVYNVGFRVVLEE